MQRILTVLLLLAVIVAAGAFFGAPYFGFFALRSAAQSQDVQGLNQLVDYDAVRASLKAQLTGTNAAPPSFWEDPVGAIKNAISPLEPTPRVEALIKPASLYALTEGRGWDALKAKTPDANAYEEQRDRRALAQRAVLGREPRAVRHRLRRAGMGPDRLHLRAPGPVPLAPGADPHAVAAFRRGDAGRGARALNRRTQRRRTQRLWELEI